MARTGIGTRSLLGRVLVGLCLLGSPLAGARPMPLLGPDGPLELGPILASEHDVRGVVEVDPYSGKLCLELSGAAGEFSWTGEGWRRDGLEIQGEDASNDDRGRDVVPEGARFGFQDGALSWLIDHQGGQVRLDVDQQRRPVGVSWSDGSHVEIERDDFGRLLLIRGPGTREQRLVWRDGGFSLSEPEGKSLRVSFGPPVGASQRSVTVEDSLGRTARTFIGARPDGTQGVLGWEDPRGLQTWITRTDRSLTVADGGGRYWTVDLDAAGQVVAVSEPGGGRWVWRRDVRGRVIGIEEPAGRIHSWDRDEAGRLIAVGRGLVPWTLRRDGQGRVTEIVDPIGSVLALRRDGQGRIEKLVDPLGNEVAFSRSPSGQVQGITGRAGASWWVEYDSLDRPRRVVGPDGRRLELDWDQAGQLVAVRAPSRQTTWLDRSSSGELTRLRSSSGESLGLDRDALGRVRMLRWAGGQELWLGRDLAGEVVELRSLDRDTDGSVKPASDRSVVVQRDGNELPIALGSVHWTRDGAGRVLGVDAPGRSISVKRDASGSISRLQAADWWLELVRDSAGRVRRWRGSDGEVAVLRNGAGRIVREEVSSAPESAAAENAVERSTLALAWDARGRLQRFDVGQRGWRMLRDGSGHLLRVDGPAGLGLGADWDVAGRLSLLRHPAQTLLRADWTPKDVVMAVDDAGGHRLGARLWTLDPRGRVLSEEDAAWGLREWRRDGSGRVVEVDENEEPALVVTDEGWAAPAGANEVRLAANGQVATARPPPGPPAWGVGSETLSYGWTADGPLDAVAGELGAVRLVHDGLGRLTALVPERGEPLSLHYDARGRLAGLSQAGRVLHQFIWGPAVDDGPASLLASGADGASSWMPGPGGPAGVAGPKGLVDVVLGLGAAVWWLVPQGSQAVMPTDDIRGYTQIGLGEGSDADLVGPGARLLPFPGGPLLALSAAEGGAVPAGTALDPLSGQRTDGLGPLPWQVDSFYQDGGPAALDPAPWEPNPTWQQPLRLLVALGELADPLPGPWMSLPALPIATPVLPASLDQVEPPLGPPLDALPFSEDALTTAWLLACLPGAPPPDADLAARTLLSTVLSLPWLPPGVDLPLPLRWSAQAGRGTASSGSQALATTRSR